MWLLRYSVWVNHVPAHSTRTALHGRRSLVIVLVLAAAVMAAITVYVHWIWHPPQRHVEQADAVVVLAYGQDRVRKGRSLAEEGVAPNLVISRSARVQERIAERSLPVLSPAELKEGLGEEGPWIEECEADYATYRAECIYPEPNSTEGEAMEVEKLMRANGWDSIIIVTERSHMRRALGTFDACTSGLVYSEVSSRENSPARIVRRTMHEAAANARDLLFGTCR